MLRGITNTITEISQVGMQLLPETVAGNTALV